jgi:hypothetical protein
MKVEETRQQLAKLLDQLDNETRCVVYNGWWRHRDPVEIRQEIDAQIEKLVAEVERYAKAEVEDDIVRMRESNQWHHFNDVVPVLKAAQAGEWHWFENTRCKYIELRIDMRDLGCIIKDREGQRITPVLLASQPYSAERNKESS